MYESPIEIIQTQMQMQMDEGILKAIQGVGIDVNKEELIKALAYDREQYSKGYKDAIKEFTERLKKEAVTKCDWDNCVDVEDIDKLAAELVGEENA